MATNKVALIENGGSWLMKASGMATYEQNESIIQEMVEIV
jgi:hypothetical protein